MCHGQKVTGAITPGSTSRNQNQGGKFLGLKLREVVCIGWDGVRGIFTNPTEQMIPMEATRAKNDIDMLSGVQ